MGIVIQVYTGRLLLYKPACMGIVIQVYTGRLLLYKPACMGIVMQVYTGRLLLQACMLVWSVRHTDRILSLSQDLVVRLVALST